MIHGSLNPFRKGSDSLPFVLKSQVSAFRFYPSFSSSAFTLTELLVVMAIIVILASAVGPTIGTALRGTNLTQAADKVIGILNIARQTAVTKNQTVEVRFYFYTNTEIPGDTGQGHAIQAFTLSDSGVYSPMMKAQTLPSTVLMSTNSTWSSLFSIGTNTTPTNPIPRVGLNYTYCSFQIYRSGMTSLIGNTTTTNWFLSLVNAVDAQNASVTNGAAVFPVNYTTLVIDPYNASLKVYRPTL